MMCHKRGSRRPGAEELLCVLNINVVRAGLPWKLMVTAVCEAARDKEPSMVLRSALILIVVASLGAVQSDTDAAKLQGTWSVETLEKPKKATKEELKEMRVVIRDDTFHVIVGGEVAEAATFKLVPSKKPKQIDLQPAPPSREKRTSHGIYKLGGDTLTVFLRKEGGERPSDFSTKADDRKSVLMILKRKDS